MLLPASPFSYHLTSVSPRTADEPEPDLTVLFLDHRATRTDLARLTDLFGKITAGGVDLPRRRTQSIARYTTCLLTATVRHHQIEEDVSWPLLAASAGPAVNLSRFNRDHDEIDPVLAESMVATAQFAAPPAAPGPGLAAQVERAGVVAGCLGELATRLDVHIPDEERDAWSMYARYVGTRDHEQAEGAIRRAYPRRELTFLVPWLARHATEDEREGALRSAGVAFRLLLAATRGALARLEHEVFAG